MSAPVLAFSRRSPTTTEPPPKKNARLERAQRNLAALSEYPKLFILVDELINDFLADVRS